MGPDAEHQTGGLAVAVALKADAAIQIKQQTIAKMGLQLFLITAPAPGPGKIGSIGSALLFVDAFIIQQGRAFRKQKYRARR